MSCFCGCGIDPRSHLTSHLRVKKYLIVVPALTQSEYVAKYGRDPGYKGCSRQADHSTTTGICPLVIYFAGQRLHQELDDLRSQAGSRVAGATILNNEKTCPYSSSRTNIVPARSYEHACFKYSSPAPAPAARRRCTAMRRAYVSGSC
jgi:hypothetical protein